LDDNWASRELNESVKKDLTSYIPLLGGILALPLNLTVAIIRCHILGKTRCKRGQEKKKDA
jgi:hypothetical protein